MHNEGLLIARFGATAEVEDAEGKIIRCHLRKNADALATGDRVIWQPEEENTGVVIDYHPRKSLLARPDGRGKIKPIAANIDAIVITMAPGSIFSEHLIDRYLIAAENLSIPAAVLLNKIDLLDAETETSFMERLAAYKTIGYPIILSSIYKPNGLNHLTDFFKDKTAVLVGPSGVGKSSIIAHLIPNTLIKMGDLHTQTGLGKHTTTASRLYHLPTGGNIIDSPGVRDFSLWNMTPQDILKGFVDFKPYANQCKFRNCQHNKEPQCAIKEAVSTHKISEQRFASY